MKSRDIKELPTKSIEELHKMLAEAKKESSAAYLELAQFKAKNTKLGYNKRKEVAQILTVLRRKELSHDKSA